MPVVASALRLTRGLRFRITVSYAIFFILIAAGAGAVSRQSLQALLEARSREALSQEWGAIKGYLHIEEGRPVWFYDRDDPDESFIVGRLQRIYLLAAASGQVLERSDLYRSIGIDSPEEIRDAIESNRPVWRIRRDPEGMPYLIRSGVFLDERSKTRYYVAIGRSLVDSRRVVEQFTWLYFFLTPVVILGGCLIGWFLAGRALMPVHDVASAAQRISGSNLSLRIAIRGAGDELDYLIATFNRMIERLESSFEQVRRFSTDVSHELRTPITAIRGQLEVALYTAKSTDQYRDAVANALEDIERLSQIVRALLLLSQAESGQVVLQKVRLDLSVLAAEVLEQFQILAEEGNIRLIAELPAGCEAAVDRIQIERLISNLLSNAMKFTPAGGEVRVTVEPLAGRVRLEIADTGSGIQPEHLPHIFDRFYRAPGARRDPQSGLGLGLSFVSWIVKAHSGKMDVRSEPGKGSCFSVELPVDPESTLEFDRTENGARQVLNSAGRVGRAGFSRNE
jgi:heavy metal sensor kinase